MSLEVWNAARHLLRHPEDAGLSLLLRRHELIVRVIHLSRVHRSWSLYRSMDEPTGPRLVLRLHWDLANAPRSAARIEPEVVNRVAYIAAPDVDALVERGRAIAVPLVDVVERRVGVDGECWEVECGDAFNHVTLSWWQGGPDAWQPFAEWTRTLAALLDERVEAEL